MTVGKRFELQKSAASSVDRLATTNHSSLSDTEWHDEMLKGNMADFRQPRSRRLKCWIDGNSGIVNPLTYFHLANVHLSS